MIENYNLRLLECNNVRFEHAKRIITQMIKHVKHNCRLNIEYEINNDKIRPKTGCRLPSQNIVIEGMQSRKV